jgi:hypothetical protein
MLFKSWDELGLRRRLIVTSVVSLKFLLHSIKNLSLTELYMGHPINKWCSSSTLSLHALQNHSLAGIVGLQYLPVSIARLCALNLSFVKRERTYLLILNIKYFCSSKVVRILLKNLSFPVSLFLICINWFIRLPE